MGQKLVDCNGALLLFGLAFAHNRVMAQLVDVFIPHAGHGGLSVKAGCHFHVLDNVSDGMPLTLSELQALRNQFVPL
ncbi:hypothetical protein SDC9_135735 [bioreactor metagenome]|uniref:Uncharacterized protein n=1 Tax=bioreactor metagenome TaxID=1076179 RepID=A0A645DHA7_9ZZZZ